LDEEVQNLAFIVDGAPEPIALHPDDEDTISSRCQ
jgi:hypothetical protein